MRALLVAAMMCAGCTQYHYANLSYTDQFSQETSATPADVLFVVDASPSMAEEQGLLAENFASFLGAITGTSADFQMGVTTTDADGTLRGGVLTPKTPDLGNVGLQALLVGTNGSRDERGLLAASAAVDPAINPGFHRKGAVLNIVVFSDEDDHSSGPVSDYLTALEGVAGKDYAVHAVVGDLPDGCASGSSAADAGTRYLEAAATTAGYVDSICAEDYTDLLTHVGLQVAGLTDTFALSHLPKPDTIVVTVDDVEMTMRPVDGWEYDPASNSIVFSGRAVPRPGMAIGVTYQQLAGEAP